MTSFIVVPLYAFICFFGGAEGVVEGGCLVVVVVVSFVVFVFVVVVAGVFVSCEEGVIAVGGPTDSCCGVTSLGA